MKITINETQKVKLSQLDLDGFFLYNGIVCRLTTSLCSHELEFKYKTRIGTIVINMNDASLFFMRWDTEVEPLDNVELIVNRA